MSKTFLTKDDVRRLTRFPEDIPQGDLVAYFQLSQDEHHLIAELRGDHNRLGFAVQLCGLRYLGFLPNHMPDPTQRSVGYLAEQLDLKAGCLHEYGQHTSTLYQHQQMVLQYLSFRRASPLDVIGLEAWLLDRALEHDKPKLLFELACEYLRRNRVVRLGVTQLVRLVGAARVAAVDVCYERLQDQLTQDIRDFLDSLISSESGWSLLSWLQRTPNSNSTASIVKTLEKLVFLNQHAVASWRLEAVNPNRLKWLAKKGDRTSAQRLRQMKAQSRYPILMAFLQETHTSFTDAVIEMVDQRLWELYSEAKREFKNDRLAATESINETLMVFKHIGRVLIDRSVDDATVRKLALEQLAEGQLETALSKADQLIRPVNDELADYLVKRHDRMQRFSKRFLRTMRFHAGTDDAGLLEGLEFIKAIHAGERRKLPTAAPTAFVPPGWANEVFTEDGLDWRGYEVAALWVLRQKLRSADIYVEHSRRFTELERYLIPKGEWADHQKDVAGLLGASLDVEEFLAERFGVLEQLASRVELLLQDDDSDIREENGTIIVSPLEMEKTSPELSRLRQLINERLPKCNITDVLVEVDKWTRFSDAFEHLDGVRRRNKDLLTSIYACLLAQACNIGFKPMADAAELSHDKLLWCNRWYFTDTTLDEAIKTLINYHHQLPFSEVWGAGMLSSSDGQRFPVRGHTRRARALPRYFGYGKGVTFYTWTSDQFSQYGSRVIPSTIRDATYVLDALLDNETDLEIVEHTTDTSGYTELVFALFGLLGMTFSPRIRDLADQQLYRPGGLNVNDYPLLRSHLTGTLHEGRIRYHWNEMLRYALSLKKGYCTASLIIKKLQAYPRQHPITRALQEFGRLEKTIHILRWYEDIYTRKRVSKQLNKGEVLHRLRSTLLFGKHGEIDSSEDEPLDLQVACLNFVTNAVVIFNTVYIANIIRDLKTEGIDIREDELARLWPSRFSHINFLGTYHFDPEKIRAV